MDLDLLSINLISALVLGVSFMMFRNVAGSMSLGNLNMISYTFYLYIFLMSFVGSILIVNNLDNHYIINKIKFEQTRFTAWWMICYMIIALPAGMMVSKLFFPIKSSSRSLLDYFSRPIVSLISPRDTFLRYFLYGLSALSILAAIYTWYSMRHVPLVSLLSGQTGEALSRQRSESSLAFGGIEYIRNIFGLTMGPLLSYIAYAYYKMTKSRGDQLWFSTLFITSMVLLLSDLQKSPVILYLIGFLMMIIFIRGGVRIGRVVFFGLVALFLLVILYFSLSDTVTIDEMLSLNTGIVGRVFLTSVAGFYHSLEIFPNSVDFLGFSTISNFLSDFLGIEHNERAGRIIMEHVFPNQTYSGTTGVMNAIFISEAWANFGFMGVLLSPVYVGFVIGFLYNLFLVLPKTPVFLALYGFYSYKSTIIGGVNDYLYNANNFIVFFIIIVLLYGGYILRYIQNRKSAGVQLKSSGHG